MGLISKLTFNLQLVLDGETFPLISVPWGQEEATTHPGNICPTILSRLSTLSICERHKMTYSLLQFVVTLFVCFCFKEEVELDYLLGFFFNKKHLSITSLDICPIFKNYKF